MTRFTVSTLSAAALSIALFAAPAFSQGFTDSAAANLAKLGVQAPVESLTNDQVAQITNVLSSTDTDSAKKMRIENILGTNEATATGRLGVAQLRSSATSDLASLGIDASGVDMLTLSQLGQIQNVVSSNENQELKKKHVMGILGNEATETGTLGVTQLQDSAAADLASIGVDTEQVQMLTISQLGQIENIMSSNETDASKRAQVEKILAD